MAVEILLILGILCGVAVLAIVAVVVAVTLLRKK